MTKTSEQLLDEILQRLQLSADEDRAANDRREAFEQEQKRLVAQITVGKVAGELLSVFGGMKNLLTPGAFAGDFVQKSQERAKVLLDLEKRSLAFGNTLDAFKIAVPKFGELTDKFGTKFGTETALDAISTGIAGMKDIPDSVIDLGMEMRATGQSSKELFSTMRTLSVQGGLQKDGMNLLSTRIQESSRTYNISSEKLAESIMLLSDRMLDYGALGLTEEVAGLMQAATAKFGAGSEKLIASFITQLTQGGNIEKFARLGVSQADIDAIFDANRSTDDRLNMLSELAGKMGDSFKGTTEVFRSGAMGQFEAQNQAVGLTGEIGKTAIAFKGLQESQKRGTIDQGTLSEAIVNQKDIQTELFNSFFDNFGKFINSIGSTTQLFTYLGTVTANLGFSIYTATQFGKSLAPPPPPRDFIGPLPPNVPPTFKQAWGNIGRALIGRDNGGTMNAGEPYITGENKPEVISTKTGGARVSVIDNNQLNSIMMRSMGAMMIVTAVQQIGNIFTETGSKTSEIMSGVLTGITTLITLTQTMAMVKSMGGLSGMFGAASIGPLLGPLLPVLGVTAVVGALGYGAYKLYESSKEQTKLEQEKRRLLEEEKQKIARGETNRMLTSISAEIKSSVLSNALGKDEQKIIIELLKENLNAAYKIVESGAQTVINTIPTVAPLNPNSGGSL